MSTPDLGDWYKAWTGLTSTSPWHALLDNWWDSAGRHTSPGPGRDVFEKLVTQSKSFYQLAEQLARAGEMANTASDWQRSFDHIFSGRVEGPDPSSLNALYQAPLEFWQRSVAGAAGVLGHQADEKLKTMFSIPGVGHTRESQERQQRYTRCLIDYQSALKEYAAALAELHTTTLDRVRARLVEHAEQNREPITSVRELYDIWIDCGEEVYGEYVMTETYARHHAGLVNARMRLTRETNAAVAEVAAALNLPARAEMDSVHRMLHGSRRQVRTLHHRVETLDAANRSLHEKVRRLEQRLEKPKAGGAKAAATNPAEKSGARRKAGPRGAKK